MISLVLDASVAVELFLRGREPDPALRRRVLTGSAAAPELLDLEVCSVVRKMVIRKQISVAEATEALRDIRDSPVMRVAHRHLVNRVWELRDNITAYDASYVALAEVVDAPLITCDARMSRSSGHTATIEVYPSS